MGGIPYTKNPLMNGFTENYFETTDHIKLRYLHKGEGFPLILIHGGFDDADTWMLNAPEFSKEYSVYCIDLRGHGYSVATHGAHIHRLSADIAEFIDSLEEPKVNLVGWSMGCSVIWGYIELFGQSKINKVVFDDEPVAIVANPQMTAEEVLRTGSNPMDFWQIVNAAKVQSDAWSNESTPLADAFMCCFRRGVLGFSEEISKQIPGRYYELMSQRPAGPSMQSEFVSRLVRDHLMLDWTDLFSQITVPVLQLTGDISIATTPECGEWYSQTMPNCKWVRFSAQEYGIHDLNQTAYQKFNRVVLDFLRN